MYRKLPEPMLRTVILIIIGLAMAAWLWVLIAAFLAMREGGMGLGIAAPMATGVAFVVFAMPAFLLAVNKRLLWLALVLALLSLISVILVA
jgi:hypothetical protein